MHLGAGAEGDDPQPPQESVWGTDGAGWLRGADKIFPGHFG